MCVLPLSFNQTPQGRMRTGPHCVRVVYTILRSSREAGCTAGGEAVTRDKAFAFFVGGMSAPRIFPSITLTPRDPISCTLYLIQSAAFWVRHRNSSAHAKGRGTRLAEDGNPWIAGTAVDEHRSWSAAGSRRADEFRRPCVLKDGALLSSRCTKRRSSSPSARPVLLSPPMR